MGLSSHTVAGTHATGQLHSIPENRYAGKWVWRDNEPEEERHMRIATVIHTRGQKGKGKGTKGDRESLCRKEMRLHHF
mgnify:CR=1 FL=1